METAATAEQIHTPAAHNPSWSNWVGAIVSVAFAASIIVRASHFSVLLIPTIAHEVLIAVSFLRRGAPKRRLTAWHARCLAYVTGYFFMAFTLAAASWRPNWVAITPITPMRILGGYLWLFGTLFGLWALWFLRRSFSVEPHARELVIRGPYTIARHPIYLSYILQYAGIVLSHFTVPYALCFSIWFVMTFLRARFEERVLRDAFPDYEAYRSRVGMFGPNLVVLSGTSASG